MNTIPVLTAAALATLALAACDRPGTKTSSATVGGTTTTTTVTSAPTNPTPTADSTTPTTSTVTTSVSTTTPSADTSSTAATGANSANAVSDTIVTGKVKTAITADNAMSDADISVKTENGIVTLTGAVKSPEQVTLAAALAQRQEGVSRVENQVAVK